MAESFRLHETVPGSERIGKDPSTLPAAVVEPICAHVTLPIVADTQVSTTLVPTTVGGVVGGTWDGSLPLGRVDEVIGDTWNGALPLDPSV